MRHLLRPAAALAAGALITTTFATPAEAAADDRGGRWLERQLTAGLVHNDQYGFDDYGLTVDFGLGLDEIGGQRDAVRSIRRAMSHHVDDYTTYQDDVYAGPVAKLLVFAQSAGADPRSYGDVNLVRRLNHRVSTQRRILGRIQDRSASGTDYANTIGQAFAARGLSRTGSGKRQEAIRFLLRQQCDRGWFRLTFSDVSKRRQGCAARPDTPDTDATALAVISLDALRHRDRTRAVRRAITDAGRWLVRHQKRNGSFGGGATTEASNANSTGLAAWALAEIGRCRPAAKAARWARKLQVGGDLSGTPLAGERGAVAYDRAAQREAATAGITDASRDQWRRTTAQAAPGLGALGGC